MAFVRWRGGCAQLLASVWEDGRSRPMLLTHWPGFAASVALRAGIAARCPTLTVDGAAVDRALVAGPPGRPALMPPARPWAETAPDLRTWALTTDVPRERTDLEMAARVLTLWATRVPASSPSLPP